MLAGLPITSIYAICSQLVDFLAELIEQFRFGQLPDNFAVPEQQCLALSTGDSDVGFASFARPVYCAAHERDLELARRMQFRQILILK